MWFHITGDELSRVREFLDQAGISYRSWNFPAITCDTDWGTVKRLKEQFSVTVEPDRQYLASNTQPIGSYDNWGLDRISQRVGMDGQYRYTRLGAGVDICILDTGIQSRHLEFQSRVEHKFDFRNSMKIGSEKIYFPDHATAADIITAINALLPGTASLNGSGVRLTFATPTSITQPLSSFPVLTALGIAPGEYTDVTTADNPLLSFSAFGEDDNSHGTHVSGIAAGTRYGVAKAARLKSFKCFDRTSNGQTIDILAAIEAVADHHASTTRPVVVNMSFGGPRSAVMNAAVESLVQRGVICCVAAGNNSINAFSISPASAGCASMVDVDYAKKPLVVGATTKADTFADFSNFEENETLAGTGTSNYGSIVDVLAPGASIISSVWSETSTSAYAAKSGTSMATPFAAGLAALYLDDNPDWQTVRPRMIADSTKNVISMTAKAGTDQTPNRILYQPFNDASFIWETDSILATVNEGMEIAATVVARSTDPAGNPLPVTYTVSGQTVQIGGNNVIAEINGSLNCLTGRISGTAPSTDTDITLAFTLIATDSIGRVIARLFTVNVVAVNAPPVWVTPSQTYTVAEGQAVNIPLLATDTDPLSFGLLAGSLPTGLSLSGSGVITGVPANPTTTHHTAIIRATDGGGLSADRAFSFIVTAEDSTPYWEPAWLPASLPVGPYTIRRLGIFNLGDAVDVKIMAVDPDGDPLTIAAHPSSLSDPAILSTRLPDGLAISGTELRGTIAGNNGVGKHVFDLTATDGTTVIRETFFIEITDAASTGSVISDIIPRPLRQNILRIPGSSLIQSITATVRQPFSGYKPVMSLGVNAVDDILPTTAIDLTYPNTITIPLNKKFNEPNDIDVVLSFSDESRAPEAYVEIVNSAVTAINLLSPGNGYRTAPSPQIVGTGSGAVAATTLTLVAASIGEPGTGYQVGDMVRIASGTATSPAILVVRGVTPAGGLEDVQIVMGGKFLNTIWENPVLPGTFNGTAWVGTAGTGGVIRADFGIGEVFLIAGGFGYLSAPTVTFPGNGVQEGLLDLTIEYRPTDSGVFFWNVQWVTDRHLGELVECEAVPFQLKAMATGNYPVTYSLVGGYGDLPAGIALNNVTGELHGIVGYVPTDTTFHFRVRASVGPIYEDRDFTLIVRNVYQNPVITAFLPITGDHRREWIAAAPRENLFRPNDENFGIVDFPSLYVIGGIPDTDDAHLWAAISGQPGDHYHPDRLIVGRMEAITVKQGNVPLYDVIIRDIIDPMNRDYVRGKETVNIRSGGWTGSGDRSTVIDAHGRAIYPTGLHNWRHDLRADVSARETLPRWMNGQYRPAVVIAYMQPGTGEEFVKTANDTDPVNGMVWPIDRLAFRRFNEQNMTLDDGILVPDPVSYPVISTRVGNGVALVNLVDYLNYLPLPTGPQYSATLTKAAMQARAVQRAVDRGETVTGERTPPYLTDDWQTSDYLPHENPDQTPTSFDDGRTRFDPAYSFDSIWMRFPPSDT